MKEGWKYMSFSQVCHSIKDGDWIESKDQSDSGIRLIQTGNIGIGYYKDKEDRSKYISEETFKRLHCTEIEEGDVLISRLPDPVGRSCVLPLLPTRSITAVDCSILKLKTNIIIPLWFIYFTQSDRYFSNIKSQCSGSTRLRITRKKLCEIQIPIPPLSEQQRIVSRLDASFAKIDALTKQAEEALEHAKALFQAKLKELMEKKEGWEEKKIEEVSENLDYRRKPITKGKRESGVYPYYGASGIVDYVKDYIYDEDILLVSEDGANLLARSTPIAFSVTGKVWVNNHAHVLKFDNFYTQRFVEYFFASIDISPYVTGAAQPKFNQARLNSLVVPMPPLSEQERIVQTLDSLSQKIQQLQQNYNQTLANCQALKQAILKETFE